jgi:hypothetical protein
MLGDDGSTLIRRGARQFDVRSDRDVFLGGDLFRVRVKDPTVDGGIAIAMITLQSARIKQLHRAMTKRQERAPKETTAVWSMNPEKPWVDEVVASLQSWRSYRVALRRLEAGESFCMRLELRTNHLGTCQPKFKSDSQRRSGDRPRQVWWRGGKNSDSWW